MFPSRFDAIAHCAEQGASAKKVGGVVSTDCLPWNSHFNAVDTPGSNWAVDCDDASDLICATAIVGTFRTGTQRSPLPDRMARGADASVSFRNDEWWGSSNAGNLGQGWVKVSQRGSVNMVGGVTASAARPARPSTGSTAKAT